VLVAVGQPLIDQLTAATAIVVGGATGIGLAAQAQSTVVKGDTIDLDPVRLAGAAIGVAIYADSRRLVLRVVGVGRPSTRPRQVAVAIVAVANRRTALRLGRIELAGRTIHIGKALLSTYAPPLTDDRPMSTAKEFCLLHTLP